MLNLNSTFLPGNASVTLALLSTPTMRLVTVAQRGYSFGLLVVYSAKFAGRCECAKDGRSKTYRRDCEALKQ
jgi:alpha-galactosidase